MEYIIFILLEINLYIHNNFNMLFHDSNLICCFLLFYNINILICYGCDSKRKLLITIIDIKKINLINY